MNILNQIHDRRPTADDPGPDSDSVSWLATEIGLQASSGPSESRVGSWSEEALSVIKTRDLLAMQRSLQVLLDFYRKSVHEKFNGTWPLDSDPVACQAASLLEDMKAEDILRPTAISLVAIGIESAARWAERESATYIDVSDIPRTGGILRAADAIRDLDPALALAEVRFGSLSGEPARNS